MEPELFNAALSLDEDVGLHFVGENVVEETIETKGSNEESYADEYYGCFCS